MAPGGKGRMATWYSRWRWHAGTTRICTQRSSGRGAVVDEQARGGRGAGIPEEVTRGAEHSPLGARAGNVDSLHTYMRLPPSTFKEMAFGLSRGWADRG